MGYKILIAEDDEQIAAAMAEHIAKWGYEVQCVQDFSNLLSEFISFDPQLVLLDIGLPFYNGYYWCGEIRQISKVPIIFVSSSSDNMNIIQAVSMGGDDFIAKPFALSVLTAKIQALLRRSYSFAGQTDLLEHKGVILNLADFTLSFRGQKIELTKNEHRILHTLFFSQGAVVSREKLMAALWETDSYIDENTLSVNIARLRRKLATLGLKDFILTEIGAGYRVQP